MEITKEQMIGQGNTAEIYRLDDNKILKLFRNGLYKGIIEKEYQNGIIIQNVLNCVPKVYEMVEINGRHGIIYEEVQGKDMLKIMLGSFWKINYYAKELAHYHLSIQLPVKEPLTTVKEKLEADLQNIDMLSDQNKEYIRKYLAQLPDGNMLCHFDFHPGNVMIAGEKMFILDWMTACSGDACADIARTCIMLKYGEVAHAPFLVRKMFSLIQHHIYRLYIKEYLKISYRSIDDINRWELPVAAARLREWISDNEKKKLLQLVNKWCNKSDLTS
jgi:Predicted aminoglycoside phosphotransferase